MPYITKKERKEIDRFVEPLIEFLKKVPIEKVDGKVNYVFTKILKNVYTRRYFDFNRAIGVLACVMLEFYRRIIAPYENEKIKQHGDVK